MKYFAVEMQILSAPEGCSLMEKVEYKITHTSMELHRIKQRKRNRKPEYHGCTHKCQGIRTSGSSSKESLVNGPISNMTKTTLRHNERSLDLDVLHSLILDQQMLFCVRRFTLYSNMDLKKTLIATPWLSYFPTCTHCVAKGCNAGFSSSFLYSKWNSFAIFLQFM